MSFISFETFLAFGKQLSRSKKAHLSRNILLQREAKFGPNTDLKVNSFWRKSKTFGGSSSSFVFTFIARDPPCRVAHLRLPTLSPPSLIFLAVSAYLSVKCFNLRIVKMSIDQNISAMHSFDYYGIDCDSLYLQYFLVHKLFVSWPRLHVKQVGKQRGEVGTQW